MRRCGIVLVILLFAAGTAMSQTKYLKIKKENLRTTPQGEKMGEVFSGAEMKVVEKQGNWVKVQMTGWIWEKSLTGDPTLVEGYSIRASHILVKTQQEADAVLAAIRGGASFEDKARAVSIDKVSGSIGGDLGRFGRGDLRPEFEAVAFKLKVGEVSNVVKTDIGYHIIKRTK